MLMTSKFGGRCRTCNNFMPAGTQIDWQPGRGANHAGPCPAVAVKPAGPKVDQTLIVDFLNRAKVNGLKQPKVRFIAPQGGELRLSMAGATSKYQGAVQIKINNEWVGRINADGTTAGRIDQTLLDTLNTIAGNPADAAKKYGALSGHCSFCNLHLTDEGSVEVGYGPVCAKNYGLPHQPKGTKTVSKVNVLPSDAAGRNLFETEL
jgi:hypothetical protein